MRCMKGTSEADSSRSGLRGRLLHFLNAAITTRLVLQSVKTEVKIALNDKVFRTWILLNERESSLEEHHAQVRQALCIFLPSSVTKLSLITWLQIWSRHEQPRSNSDTSKDKTHPTDVFLALVAANLAVELRIAEIGHAVAVLQSEVDKEYECGDHT